MMKKYKVRKELELYVTQILRRCYYSWRSEYDKNNDVYYVYTNCPSNAFHRVVMRALCEYESRKDGICYVTLEETKDMFETEDILQFHHADSYVIINADECPEWLL